MPDIKLPPQFWMTWGGVCPVWIMERSAERRDATGKIVGMITGSKLWMKPTPPNATKSISSSCTCNGN